jgi:hypothetical protein
MGTARIPSSDLVGQEGDVLYFVVSTEDLPALDERLGDVGLDTGGHH